MSNTGVWDVVVIGSGPGGYAAAFRASDLGKRVLLIERDEKLGGVCLNRGCIPSKALLHIVKIVNEAQHLSKVGVSFGDPKFDIEKIRNHKNKIISQLNGGISQLAKARKVSVLSGKASFVTNSEILVETKDRGVYKIYSKYNKSVRLVRNRKPEIRFQRPTPALDIQVEPVTEQEPNLKELLLELRTEAERLDYQKRLYEEHLPAIDEDT